MEKCYAEVNILGAFRAGGICLLNRQELLKKLQEKSRKSLLTLDGDELNQALDQGLEEEKSEQAFQAADSLRTLQSGYAAKYY